ncbi:MAG: DivIVA domain-containing protein [Ilumatobacteraceae bacterium]
MALSPQRIREANFKSARRGYDQTEVDSFVQEVAGALEAAQNDATAMEARARAAVARLQELTQGQPGEMRSAAAPADIDVKAHVDEAETISRALLLAQRTADQTVADAQVEADRLVAAANAEAATRVEGARSESTQLIEEAKVDARRDGEAELVRVEGEVQALLARRDFLESDVDHLEQFVVAQRERITEAVSDLQALIGRVPSGLADMRRPLLSAVTATPTSSSSSSSPTAGAPDHAHGESEIGEITRVAEAEQSAAVDDDHDGDDGDEGDEGLPPPEDDESAQRWDRAGQ